MTRSAGSFMFSTIFMMVLVALVFGMLKAFNIHAGTMVDWIIGIATAFWLLVITTVPWNVYFEALSVEDEASMSRTVGIAVDEAKARYVKKLKMISLAAAIFLHVVSSAVLFYLAVAHITPVGFYGGIAAALLTFLRPAVRAYDYLWQRLRDIRQGFKYPREDVVTLRHRLDEFERNLRDVMEKLDPNNSLGLPADMKRNLTGMQKEIDLLANNYTQLAQSNREEHEALRREAQTAIAKLSSDSQFLDHVREIVRMIKSA